MSNNRERLSKRTKNWIMWDVQGGKCLRCGKLIAQLGVRPSFHHKNFDSSDNRTENYCALCPNCHDIVHQLNERIPIITNGIPFDLKNEFNATTKTSRNKNKELSKKYQDKLEGCNRFRNSPAKFDKCVTEIIKKDSGAHGPFWD